MSGVGFANYDTLYALAWGGQLARGELPAYEVADRPDSRTRWSRSSAIVLSPLGAGAVERA